MQPGRTSEENVTASVACQNGDSGVQRVHKNSSGREEESSGW